jgi:BirA family transcriptional regulator, biotin operon repressor / biotin---[acetyl-CoA-carboxylase] ligase
MGFALSPRAKAAGYRLQAFDTIDSTNAEAMRLGRAGEGGPLWIVARHQSAGRGRRGRAWATAAGNLAATLLLTLDLPPVRTATLGFVAGLALREALTGLAGTRGPHGGRPIRFALKWPNDVLADDAKIAGILLESDVGGAGARLVAVGLGVNVAASPKNAPYPATSLAEVGHDLDAEQVFHALSESWTAYASIWDAGRGMSRIRELWLHEAAGLGQPIAVRLNREVVSGVFETIDEAGQLVIRTPAGPRRTIAAGEVHFGAAATAPVEA